jgi:BNR repeat-like domain
MRHCRVRRTALLDLILFGSIAVAAQAIHAQQPSTPPALSMHNTVVYREPGRYAAWPANHGIWSWGNEIVVGFESGVFKEQKNRHSIDWDKPAEHLLARSLDGGETWTVEHHPELRPPNGMKVAGVPTEPGGKQAVDCPGGINFRQPGFALTARMSEADGGPSRFYYTTDRGKFWFGPYNIPNFGFKGTAARTDYRVYGKHNLVLFLTVSKSNGKEGRVIVVRTRDGAKTWKLVSLVGPEPSGPDFAIMPSTVALSRKSVVMAIRHPTWIELWRSDDHLHTWHFVSRPAPDLPRGNPPSLVHLRDGRLAITYGYRAAPYQIRARLSSDEGRTWGPEIVLRSNAGAWDLGYTRSVQRPDGKIVTIYYWSDAHNQERYIAATIWDPGTAERH